MYFEGIILVITNLIRKTGLELTVSGHILEKNYVAFQHIKDKLQYLI